MSTHTYYPIEKRLRVRRHNTTGRLQIQTIGGGIRGWRNVPAAPPVHDGRGPGARGCVAGPPACHGHCYGAVAMIIWEYKSPASTGLDASYYGTPVEVFLPGLGYTQVVYQFPGGEKHPAAVVHHRSGQVLCAVTDPRGSPQEQARNSIAAYFRTMSAKYPTAAAFHAVVRAAIYSADTVNGTVIVVPPAS